MTQIGVDEDTVRALVARLPGSEERSHFGHPDFRVKNRIFATLWPADHRCNVRLPHALALEVVQQDPETHRLIAERGHIGWVGVSLARTTADALGGLLEQAWLLRAPPNPDSAAAAPPAGVRARPARRAARPRRGGSWPPAEG
ncbi:MAG: MmcQ/YjbR family DNA-binding protein [Chloroflexi bacterium]|nr:MmcQ/YjbR family DNA-binding protein [Chloroflexota bacterium]